jgi:polysaccharide biosynthesis protein PslA
LVAEFEQTHAPGMQSRRISPAIVRNIAQIIDATAILSVGFLDQIIYVFYITNTDFSSPYFAGICMGAAIACFLLNSFGAYEQEHLFSKRYAVQRIVAAWAITFAILLFIAFALKISDHFSRVWAVTWFLGGGSLLIISRLCLSEWIQRRALEGVLAERTIIFGAGEFGQKFAEQIRKFDDPFIKVMGFIDDRKTRVPSSSKGFQVLGDSTTLLHLIRANMVDHVFIALPLDARLRVNQVIEQLAQMPVRVSLVSSPLAFDIQLRTIKYINKAPTFLVFDQPLTGWSNLGKWLEDRLIAILILLFIAPLMAVIAIAIKLNSDGPVIFRQKRFGFNNNPIDVWKFRTMYVGEPGHLGRFQQATKGDPRVTPVGRFLRKSSLDELPQFFNVLLGNMSIVGPRPHALAHTHKGLQLEEIIEQYAARHRVKPGITGWAQVNGWRGETDTIEKLKKRVEYDLYYIENWSIFFDLWIIWRTIILIFKDRNAY